MAYVVLDWGEGSARWEFEIDKADEVLSVINDILGSPDTIT